MAAYRVLLCCELVGAVRLLRQRRLQEQFTGVLGAALELASALPHNDEDRDLRGDIALADTLLDDLGRIVERIPVGIRALASAASPAATAARRTTPAGRSR